MGSHSSRVGVEGMHFRGRGLRGHSRPVTLSGGSADLVLDSGTCVADGWLSEADWEELGADALRGGWVASRMCRERRCSWRRKVRCVSRAWQVGIQAGCLQGAHQEAAVPDKQANSL